jgi:hypothetical protein
VLASLLATCCILGALSACRSAPRGSDLAGAWSVREIEFVSASGRSLISSPQPGQAIFTERHYSLLWVQTPQSLRSFQQRWVPTDAEKIQRYGEIVVNSGEYMIESDSSVILRPRVSRVPEFVGGRMSYAFRIRGDTLWLSSLDEYSFDGVQAPWAAAGNTFTLKFVRAEALNLK